MYISIIISPTNAMVGFLTNKNKCRKVDLILIKINQWEADYLIKNVPTRRLKKASERKKHNGKTYYILCDDADSLQTIAMLRHYIPVKKTIVSTNGKRKEIIVSPVQQLLNDN